MAAEGLAAGKDGDHGGLGRQWNCVIKEALVGCLLESCDWSGDSYHRVVSGKGFRSCDQE